MASGDLWSRLLEFRVLGGVAAGAAATVLLLRWLPEMGVGVAEIDAGQLVNRSAFQKRHAFHADMVDDAPQEDGPVEKPAGHPRDWQEKEDSLIRLLFDLMRRDGCTLKDACETAEHYIYEYLAGVSRDLARVAPELVAPSHKATAVRRLHAALPLSEAFRKYDSSTHISSRKKVPPQFREVRNIVNLAQLLATASAGLRLITFDGDGTLYPDRFTLEDEEDDAAGAAEAAGGAGGETGAGVEGGPAMLITQLVALLDAGVTVALVTAVGDPSPEPYQRRLAGLVRRLVSRPGGAGRSSLYAVGGQCNYVFRFDARKGCFVPLPREKWEPDAMRSWTTANISALLDAAQAALIVTANQLGMAGCVKLVRKERAVGLLYTGEYHRTTAYFLDELALKARDAVKRLLKQSHIYLPFCTFNGGRDVFVDVGSKELGINLLRELVSAERAQTLHVGDQFSRTGNDLLARRACGTVWVDDPRDTSIVLKLLLDAMEERQELGLSY